MTEQSIDAVFSKTKQSVKRSKINVNKQSLIWVQQEKVTR